MSLLVNAARLAVGINAILLLVLIAVWGQNYLRLRSKHTIGLLVFGVMLFLENVFSLYFYLLDPTLSIWFSTQVPNIAWRAMLLLHLLETVAIGVITWTTLD